MDSSVRARLANLKDKLEITDAQADAWKSYAGAVAARAKAIKTARRAMEDAMDQDSPVDLLDARISGMEAVLESLKAMKPMIEKLYGVLSDDQKKGADDVIGAGARPDVAGSLAYSLSAGSPAFPLPAVKHRRLPAILDANPWAISAPIDTGPLTRLLHWGLLVGFSRSLALLLPAGGRSPLHYRAIEK